MEFELLASRLAVCALREPVLPQGEFVSLTMSGGEVSLVCEEVDAPEGCKIERGWRALRIKGPLDFSLVGILAHVSRILADADISLFAVSTYETDYVLIKEVNLGRTVEALKAQGHTVAE